MAVKRIINWNDMKSRICLKCGRRMEQVLKDNTICTCEHCGQQHYIDKFADRIAFTVIERPDARKRHKTKSEPEDFEEESSPYIEVEPAGSTAPSIKE